MGDASQKKLKQMLEVLIMLSQKYGRSKESLAEHFGTSIKTISRYMETFREVGFVLKRTSEGYWQLDKDNSDYKDLSELLHFSEDESAILSNAIDSIDTTTELKEQLKRKLYSLYNIDRIATPLAKKQKATHIAVLSKAISEKKQVILSHYSSANTMQVSDRLIEPFNFTHNFADIWAYEPQSGMNKMFKLERIGKVKPTKADFMFEQHHQKTETDVFRMSSTKTMDVKLKLSLKAKNLLIEEFPRAEKFIEKNTDNEYLFSAPVRDWKGVGRFILGLSFDIDIVYPDELKNYVVNEMEKGLKKIKNNHDGQ